ncbi:MAG: sugar ABC transporter permease [Actinomycetota bacterium]
MTSVDVQAAETSTTRPKKVGSSSTPLDGGWKVAIWFLLPSLIGFVVFFLYPTLRGVYLSFTDWNLLSNQGEWIGGDNYSRLIDDSEFYASMRRTLWYVFLNIGSQTILAVMLAVMMDRLTKSSIIRGVLLLPWLMPNVVVALLWLWMLDGSVGIVNSFIEFLGFDPIRFFQDTGKVIPTVAGINTWKFTGYTALLLFAGLQTIPKTVYEAAAMDGASEWQMFRRITLPLMRPVLALVLVLTIVGSFQVFDIIQVATGGFGGQPGGPVNASRVIYLYIYQNAINFNDLGYAAALSVVLVAILLIVTALQLKLLRAGESDLAS